MGRGRLEPGVARLMELLLAALLLLATAAAQRRDGEFQSLMFVSKGKVPKIVFSGERSRGGGSKGDLSKGYTFIVPLN